jgi:hypothetical protein
MPLAVLSALQAVALLLVVLAALPPPLTLPGCVVVASLQGKQRVHLACLTVGM